MSFPFISSPFQLFHQPADSLPCCLTGSSWNHPPVQPRDLPHGCGCDHPIQLKETQRLHPSLKKERNFPIPPQYLSRDDSVWIELGVRCLHSFRLPPHWPPPVPLCRVHRSPGTLHLFRLFCVCKGHAQTLGKCVRLQEGEGHLELSEQQWRYKDDGEKQCN